MFEEQPSLNGDGYVSNAHDEKGYEHPESRWIWPAKPSVSRAVASQVFGQIGNRRGTMTFDSLLDGEKR
jgi:hypothetical protein